MAGPRGPPSLLTGSRPWVAPTSRFHSHDTSDPRAWGCSHTSDQFPTLQTPAGCPTMSFSADTRHRSQRHSGAQSSGISPTRLHPLQVPGGQDSRQTATKLWSPHPPPRGSKALDLQLAGRSGHLARADRSLPLCYRGTAGGGLRTPGLEALSTGPPVPRRWGSPPPAVAASSNTEAL